MDISQRNRKINLLQYGDLLMHLDDRHGPVVYEFLKVDSYVRGKPYRFLVRDIFLITKCGTRCLDKYDMRSDKIVFIDEDSKQYKSIKVLYGEKVL